jgi:protein SCO1
MLRVVNFWRLIAFQLSLTVTALISGNAIAADGFSNAPQSSRWGKDYLPNVEVQDQDGKTFRFFDDLIKDKLVVINFIYTSCTDICPLTTARLAQVQERLGDVVGRDIFMYSITIDPEHDTPAALKQHADAFRVGPGWKFLTGKPDDIAAIRYKLGERSRIAAEHRHEMLLGNAATGNWSRDSAFGDLERVAFNIRSLDPNWRDEKRIAQKSSGFQEIEISDNQGEALYTKACAGCHTIGRGDRVGPDLIGVSSRRDRAWLTHFISEPDKMRAQKDPVALALMTKYKGVRMPNLQISNNDANDLITYIDVQTYAFAISKTPAAELHKKTHDHTTHSHGHKH